MQRGEQPAHLAIIVLRLSIQAKRLMKVEWGIARGGAFPHEKSTPSHLRRRQLRSVIEAKLGPPPGPPVMEISKVKKKRLSMTPLRSFVQRSDVSTPVSYTVRTVDYDSPVHAAQASKGLLQNWSFRDGITGTIFLVLPINYTNQSQIWHFLGALAVFLFN